MTRRAVVTGGGTGLGKAIARRLASDGTDVVIVGRREEVLADAAREMNAETSSERVTYRSADLVDPDQVDLLAADLISSGPVDVLVNNAGGTYGGETTSLAEVASDYRAHFDLNVITSVLLTEALLPSITRPGGRIVNISSIAGLRGAGPYGAAKAAVHGWTMGLALELAADEITVNAVAPGFVPDTEFWAGRLTPEVVESRVAPIPMNRPGTPDEIAGAVAYLVGEDGGWTTGQILQVNGGTLLGRG